MSIPEYNYDNKDKEFLHSLEREEFYYGKISHTFNDFLIVPTYLEEAISRKSVDLSYEIETLNGRRKTVLPIINAPMSFFGKEFGRKFSREFIYAIPRINKSLEERIEILEDLRASEDEENSSTIVFSFGYKEIIPEKVFSRADLLMLDIAHGASKHTVNYMHYLSQNGIKSGLIVGNVGSIQGFVYLIYFAKKFGFENIYIRAGIGSGSACTTRLKTGVGFPQLDLMKHLNLIKAEISNIFEMEKNSIYLISDGGIKTFGDIAKALIYSDLVMSGKLFISKEMETYDPKTDTALYFGMASSLAKSNNQNIEGDKYLIKSPKNLEEILNDLKDSLRSSLTYTNSKNIYEFKKKAKLIKISESTILENNIG